jgi:hypothetical protein
MPTVLVAAAILVLVSVIGLPRLLGGTTAEPASQAGGAAEADSAPNPLETASESAATRELDDTGWRTEYYRDISFSVPAEWGYAIPPQSDWCANGRQATPRPDQTRPYVWLSMAVPVRSIACPEPWPDSLLTEHVEALPPGPATDYVEGAVQEGEWWIVTRFAGSAVLVVTSRDRDLADQILDSAEVVGADDQPRRGLDPPCPPASEVAGPIGARPAAGSPLDEISISSVETVAVCQYEPVVDEADVALPRLRAASVRQGAAAQDLVEQLRSAPENTSSCDPAPVDPRPELAILVRIAFSNDGIGEVYVSAIGCPDGDAGMAGGIDDGTQMRVLTRPACQALLQPPIALFSASSDVGSNCLG